MDPVPRHKSVGIRKTSRTKLTNEERALPFIKVTQTDSSDKSIFQVTDEARHFLSELTGPLAVVTVTGLYRTGKSYLINRMLLNRKQGFGVGNSINACTKGIWIWSRPLQGYTADGKPIQVLVMDTEGLGSLEEESNHDIRIFSLALLLSSSFLYNSVGSIDEETLASLELLVGVSKNIQCRASQAQKNVFKREGDPDLSSFFPSFLWVVRDFALKLEDEKGNPLSPKEYMESALKLQQGPAAQDKNKVRKAVTEFFSQRECMCMVRPVTDEQALHQLESLQIDDLRPHFVQQMTQLRRKVLNRARPKELFGNPITGVFLAGLAEIYTQAINQGGVPNIENAWSSVCRAQALKALKRSIEFFQTSFERDLIPALPVSTEKLKGAIKTIKKEALGLFAQTAVDAKEYEEQLEQQISKAKVDLLQENERQSMTVVKQFLQERYIALVEQGGGEDGNFELFCSLLNAMEIEVRGQLPDVPLKEQVIEAFLKQKISSAGMVSSKRTEEGLKVAQQEAASNQAKWEREMADLKKEQFLEQSHLKQRLMLLESERARAEGVESSLREELGSVSQEKKKLEKSLQQDLETREKQQNRKQEELEVKIKALETTVSQISAQSRSSEAQFTKEKALLEQQISYLEKAKEEGLKKEKAASQEILRVKREQQMSQKEGIVRLEEQLKQAKKKLDSTTQRNNELENKMLKDQEQHEYEKQDLTFKITRLQKELERAQYLAKTLTQTYNKLEERSVMDVETVEMGKKAVQKELESYKAEIEEKEKERAEEHFQEITNMQKEMALYEQKIEFLTMQVKEKDEKLNGEKKAHHELLRVMEEQAGSEAKGEKERALKMEELIERHKNEMVQLREEGEKMSDRMEEKLKEISIKKGRLELEVKMIKQEQKREMKLMEDKWKEAEREKLVAMERAKALDVQKVRMLEENDRMHTERLKELERTQEEKESKNNEDLESVQRSYDQTLAQMKSLHRQEKERLEQRIAEQKAKNSRLLDQQSEELEQRLAEERRAKEEEMEMLQLQAQQNEIQAQSLISHLENQNKLAGEKVKTLDAYLKEMKESLQRQQNMNSTALEKQMQRFNQERRELMEKIESQSRELASKERLLAQTQAKWETSSQLSAARERELEAKLKEVVVDRATLQERMNLAKERERILEGEIGKEKLEHNREMALKGQQVEIWKTKMLEVSKEKEGVIGRYEEKLKIMREEYQLNKSVEIEHLEKTKKMLELRLEQKTKASREEEEVQRLRIEQLEKAKDAVRENLEKLEVEFLNQKETYEKQLKILRDRLDDPSAANYEKRREELEENLMKLEREKSDLNNALQKKEALWQQQEEYFNKEKQNLKQHQENMEQQYRLMIQKMQEKLQKEQGDTSSQSQLNKMEQRYREKIKMLHEQHQTFYREMLLKNETLESQINEINAANQEELQQKEDIISELEQKLDEQIIHIQELEMELEEWRSRTGAPDQLRRLEAELEVQKVRTQALESQVQDSEQKRQDMMYQHAKDQAKSTLEKDQLIYMKNQLEQTVDRLEAKKENLIHEIEMLKSRGFSPKASELISPDRSGILTMSSGHSFLNLPMKHTTHKYSIQPYRKGNTQSTCAESQHSMKHTLSRSPIGRINTESNSPGRRTMVSGTLSDTITAVGDNDSFLNLGESEAEHYRSIVKTPLQTYHVKHRSPLQQ